MRASELPQVIPIFPLDGVLLLPDGTLPLNVFEPRYLNMIDDAMAGDRTIGIIQSRSGGDRQVPRLMEVGCVGRITSFTETPDGRYLITLTGVCRFTLRAELDLPTPYRQVRADYAAWLDDLQAADEPDTTARDALFEALKSYLDHRGLAMDWDAVRAAPVNALVSSLCMALPFDSTEKQALLEAPDLSTRCELLVQLMQFFSRRDGDAPDATLQ